MFFLLLVVFLLVGSALTVLTVENLVTPVQLSFFVWQTPDLPLGLLLLLTFIIGALFLYIVSALSALRDRNEKRQLRRQVAELEQRVATLASAATIPTVSTVIAQPAPHTPHTPMPGIPEPPRSA